jgi:hypothetical protein
MNNPQNGRLYENNAIINEVDEFWSHTLQEHLINTFQNVGRNENYT